MKCFHHLTAIVLISAVLVLSSSLWAKSSESIEHRIRRSVFEETHEDHNVAQVVQDPSIYVGRSYAHVYGGQAVDLPGNPIYLGGRMVAILPVSNIDEVKYNVAYFQQETNLLFFIVQTSEDFLSSTIVDAVSAPIDQFSQDEYVIAGQCSMSGEIDPELFAIAKNTGGQNLTEMLFIWRANRNTGRFEQVTAETGNITCQNWGG